MITGEAFIRPSDFEQLKASLVDNNGETYKNGRNLAAGSVRLLDAKTCMERRLMFMPFTVLEGFENLPRKSERLKELSALGFTPCKYLVTKRTLTQAEAEDGIKQLQQYARDKDIPIDGIVVTYNDVAFAKSCGRTGHHYKDGLAFKFEDDLFETKLQMIEWTPGRTGEIAPVAVFAPVEIDGCEVSRASLHNLSFIEDLELMPGNRILVSKRNLIIPHVEDNLDRGGFVLESAYPHRCPCCGEPTRIHETRGRNENGEERTIKTLFCDNAGCETRKLKQFVHFVGKKAMNIEGLSEATLEKLIGRGWIHSYLDIYRLDQHKDELVRMDGFGERSWQRLWSAIQQSRNTTFERYVIAMDIPMIGNTASGVLCQVFHGNLDEFRDAVYAGYDFRQLPDFGDTLHNSGKEEDTVLRHIDLELPAGTFTALVGPSGGGKSTAARLIARFWDVTDGRIAIGGVDIRNLTLKQLADQVSFVTQDNFLFDCSLKENIRLGKPDATEEEVWAAARAAQCEEFLGRLEHGWDTPAGEAGKQLSGGERQRIAIARAILKDAPIVILDEATAFTDPENEDKIQRSLMALSQGKTLLVIAHRLSTIQNADQIVVLEKGRIVDKGTQPELLSRCPLYQKLWQAHVGAQNWAVGKEA